MKYDLETIISEEKSLQELLNKAKSENQRKAIQVGIKLADMIIFHKKVRENGTRMMQPWEE